MINSYALTFGEPVDESTELADDIACDIFSEFDYGDTVEANAKHFENYIRTKFSERLNELTINDKAHILDQSFHNANENFYELEDEGIIEDRSETQGDFLNALELALNNL